MPARKMRIELFDNEGNRYTISFEGRVTRNKALRLLDLVELLGGMPGGENGSGVGTQWTELSKFEKVRLTVEKHLPITWFSSKEVQSLYEKELREPISLSTVATYLSRMASRGMLLRRYVSNRVNYRMAARVSGADLKREVPQEI